MPTALRSILSSLAVFSLACDGDTKPAPREDPAAKAASTAPPTKVEVAKAEQPARPPEQPASPVPPPEPKGTVCGGQQQQAIATNQALTDCVTKAVESSGIPDAGTTMAKLAADTHACTDKACSEKLTAAMTSYGSELAGKREKHAAGDASCEPQAHAANDANEKLHACTTAAMGGNDVDEAIAKMAAFADEMCACKVKACAEPVTANMIAYGEAMAKKHEGRPEPAVSDTQKRTMEDSMKRLTECMTRAMSG